MQVIQPDKRETRSWIKEWLKAGHEVSSAVLAACPLDQGCFYTVIGDTIGAHQLPKFSCGGVIRAKHADAWIAHVYNLLARKGARCVVVEDDLSAPDDQAVIRGDPPSAFIRDRVVSWSDLDPDDSLVAPPEAMWVGSGYPRNAFVVTTSAPKLGLENRQQLQNDFPSRIVDSLVAVVLSIFDDESYLVWHLPTGDDSLRGVESPPNIREVRRPAHGERGSSEPRYDYYRPDGSKARVYRDGRVEPK